VTGFLFNLSHDKSSQNQLLLRVASASTSNASTTAQRPSGSSTSPTSSAPTSPPARNSSHRSRVGIPHWTRRGPKPDRPTARIASESTSSQPVWSRRSPDRDDQSGPAPDSRSRTGRSTRVRREELLEGDDRPRPRRGTTARRARFRTEARNRRWRLGNQSGRNTHPWLVCPSGGQRAARGHCAPHSKGSVRLAGPGKPSPEHLPRV